MEQYGRLPQYFIENKGQLDQQVRYYDRGAGRTMFFTPKGVILGLNRAESGQKKEAMVNPVHPGPPHQPGNRHRAAVVRLLPVGMQKGVTLAGLEPQEYKVNYFMGKDPKKWHTNIPTYKAVIYREAYPGIDLKFYGQGQELEYDVVVKPGADPSQVKFAYQGIKTMEVTPGGDLALNLPDGSVLMQKKPMVYQEIAGQRVAREGKFRVQQGTAHLVYGFEVASFDPAYPLVIDPVVYSTYLGGSYEDYGLAIAVNKSGEAVITGYTQSHILYNNFPEAYARYLYSGKKDVFVTKFKSDGSGLVFSTYLGGDNDEEGRGIAVDLEGRICLTGNTYSEDFPTTGAYQGDKEGVYDAFVTKLAADGGSLIFSTYLGGTSSDYGRGIAVDDSKNVYVTGNTMSNNFPVQAALFPTYGDGKDAFVSKFSPSGSLLFSTYLGGSSSDDGAGIAVSPAGKIYVTGNTNSSNFPMANALYNTINAFTPDAFVTCIRADLGGLAFSTFLGGNGSDYGNAVALDTTGHVYVGGNTYSTVFPTHNALYPVNGGKADAFLTKFEPNGDALVFSTFLGGSEADHCYSIAVGRSDEVTLTGVTASDNFPIKGVVAGYNTLRGPYDAFVTRFRANGRSLLFSGPLGGDGSDQGLSLALDRGDQAYVTGFTNSDNFPVKNALYPYKNLGTSNYDAFYVKIRQPSTAVTFLYGLLED
ncbi:MAG: SBBP repeat-containing protein [Desulfobacterales bacterium]|nr:SBBP repeat-containing protein [Pseudomonadota bacterium]MBU4355049.1 SBBP repeat-containing protein [Pseudomonadota bacterium]MCG2771560.1 SBBP repeat-containing protein [Desulfobacterales bacterium]